MKSFYALQEIQDPAVPVRPKHLHQHVDTSLVKLKATANRWNTALELLALR